MFNKNYFDYRALLIGVIVLACLFGKTINSCSDNGVKWKPLPEGVIEKIAFGSCSNQYIAQPIWKTLTYISPDLFISLGDIIYGDAAPPGLRGLNSKVK